MMPVRMSTSMVVMSSVFLRNDKSRVALARVSLLMMISSESSGLRIFFETAHILSKMVFIYVSI